MKFLTLVLKSSFRNKRRTILTILSIAVSLFLIVTLQTLVKELEDPPVTPEGAFRVWVQHKVSLGVTMPISYRMRLRQMPGVEKVIAMQWFQGTYKDPANFFAQFAIDVDQFFDVYPDIDVSPEHRKAFEQERTACLVGASIAGRYGWKVGDKITLVGQIIPVSPELTVRGFISGGNTEATLFFRWDYLNELTNGGLDEVSTFAVMTKSPEVVPAVIESIDSTFANSTAPTKSQTENAFLQGFMTMFGNVRTLVISISTVVLFTIILVAANTMAMSIRERTSEIAIMKTLGFSPGKVLGLMVGESVAIAVTGGLLGSLSARVLYSGIDWNLYSGGFLARFLVRWETILMAVVMSVFVALTSTVVPAWGASRLPIADAIRRRGE